MLVDQIIQELGNPATNRKITVSALKNLGYLVTKRSIPLTDASGKSLLYNVTEVVDADTKIPTSFSYLFIISQKSGVLLKNPYAHYQERQQKLLHPVNQV